MKILMILLANSQQVFSDWKYIDPVGIGHFDKDGYCSSGRDVQMRRLYHYAYDGLFYGIIADDEGGSGERSELKANRLGTGKKPWHCRAYRAMFAR
jgi:hypothetical protein